MIERDFVGYTAWARKTLESDIFFNKPDKWFKIWFCLIQLANHKDNKQFKRGEVLTTYAEIAYFTGANKNMIDGFMRWAKCTTMITTRKTTRGMYVKVLKYSTYQTPGSYKNDTENDSKTELETKRKRNGNDTINKNDNNVNNDNLVGEADVAAVIEVFKGSINPTIKVQNKTYRSDAQFLIDTYGIQTVLDAASFAVEHYNEPFFPKISNPSELRNKYPALKTIAEK